MSRRLFVVNHVCTCGQKGDLYVVFKPLSDPLGDEQGIWKVTI